MEPLTIDSVKDPQIQAARALLTRSGRLTAGRALVDGARLVAQIIDAGSQVEVILVPDGPVAADLTARADSAGVPIHRVRPGVLRHVLASATPPDCLAVVPFRAEEDATAPTGRLTVVCDRVADAGNLGSIIRTASGLGCAGVVLTGTADPGGRRVIEASRGAVLRTSVHRFADGPAAVAALRTDGWFVVAADASGRGRIEEVDVAGGRVALVVGNETDGLSLRVRAAADAVAAIELVGAIDSLNVAVAAGIGLYVLRRRQATVVT